MKRHCSYGGLLISAKYSSLTISVKNSNHYSPPLKQTKHTQTVTLAIQTTPDNKSSPLLRFLIKYQTKISGLLGLLWLWTLAMFFSTEKRRLIPGWQLEDLALLKIIKKKEGRLFDGQTWDDMPVFSGIERVRYEYVQMRNRLTVEHSSHNRLFLNQQPSLIRRFKC